MIGVLQVVVCVELPQNQCVFCQGSGLVGEDETHGAERFVERHGVTTHIARRGVEVRVVVDEGGVEDLDKLERDLETGRHHGDVQQQKAQREHQGQVRDRGFHVPARVAAVLRQPDGRQHEREQDLRERERKGEPGGRR